MRALAVIAETRLAGLGFRVPRRRPSANENNFVLQTRPLQNEALQPLPAEQAHPPIFIS